MAFLGAGGVSAQDGRGGVSAMGGSAEEGGFCPGWVYTFPVDRMTDACEKITFPQLLLRTVKLNAVHGKNVRNAQKANGSSGNS